MTSGASARMRTIGGTELGGREMRVLVVTTMYPPKSVGGVASHAYDLANALSERGNEVVVLTLGEHSILAGKVRVYRCKNLAEMLLFCAVVSLRERIDLVHCHSVQTMVFGTPFKLLRKPVILTVHGESSIWQKSLHDWSDYDVRFVFIKFFEKAAIKLADHVIAVDRRLEGFVRRFRNDNISSILNCVDTSFFTRIGEFRPNGRTILCPRMLYPKNGVEYAIAAFEQVIREFPDARLLIAGDGPLRNRLLTLAKRTCKSGVKFLGSVNYFDMPRLYNRSDVVVIPSVTTDGLQEASSIAALEAMSSGVPVVATRIGGLQEIIMDKTTGFLVDERNPEQLAQKIITLLRDRNLRELISKNGREHVVRNYSRDAWVDNVTRIYRNVLGRVDIR